MERGCSEGSEVERTGTGNLCGVISVPEQDAGRRGVKAKGSLASEYKTLSGLIGFELFHSLGQVLCAHLATEFLLCSIF